MQNCCFCLGNFSEAIVYILKVSLQFLRENKNCSLLMIRNMICVNSNGLIPRPSHCPIFDGYCKRLKTGWWEGLGMRLMAQCTHVLHNNVQSMFFKFRNSDQLVKCTKTLSTVIISTYIRTLTEYPRLIQDSYIANKSFLTRPNLVPKLFPLTKAIYTPHKTDNKPHM